MPRRARRSFTALILTAMASSAVAEEYDVTVVFKDEAPLMVPFFRCSRNATVNATDETLPVCKEREREVQRERLFSAPAARITNLGNSVIWIHFGTGKLPILPGKHFRHRAVGKASFDRIFLSGAPDGVAHVFASSSGADEPEGTQR